jgi:HSP20 family protein
MGRDDRRRQAYRITETIIRTGQGGAGPGGWQPNVDVYEIDNALIVALDLAGVQPETIDISVSGRRLRISGNRAPVVRRGARRIHHLEIPHGSFDLVLDLPAPVDTVASEAAWSHGLLEIVLPLAQPVRPAINAPVRTGRQAG